MSRHKRYFATSVHKGSLQKQIGKSWDFVPTVLPWECIFHQKASLNQTNRIPLAATRMRPTWRGSTLDTWTSFCLAQPSSSCLESHSSFGTGRLVNLDAVLPQPVLLPRLQPPTTRPLSPSTSSPLLLRLWPTRPTWWGWMRSWQWLPLPCPLLPPRQPLLSVSLKHRFQSYMP